MSVPGTPLRMEVNSPWSLRRRMRRPSVRLGPRPPSPLGPWQPLQEFANSFAPAATAWGSPASGLRGPSGSGRNWPHSAGIARRMHKARIDLTPHGITDDGYWQLGIGYWLLRVSI